MHFQFYLISFSIWCSLQGVSPLSYKSKSWNMQICVLIQENYIIFHYHRKRYFHFKVSLDIFNHILGQKMFNLLDRTILTAKISKNCKVKKLLKTYLHEMKCLKQVIFDYINEKLSKNYLSTSIFHQKSTFKVNICVYMK